MNSVTLKNVDILFGTNQKMALEMLDAGATRTEIAAKTDVILGVADASLTVEEGEISVLMGLSGSGKSTLLRAINGLNPVARGKVLVKDGGVDVDITACDAATLRHMRTARIAMVFQQFALLPWRTVADNVGFGLEIRGMSKAERTRIVEEKLELVQLADWKDKAVHELSGGMQQRVGLARAFATDADILLMDEPFSALDPLIRTRLQDELLLLQEQMKKTIVFVSHDLDEALKIGNRIAIMEEARIVQYGEPEDIIRRPATEYVADFVAHMNPLNVLKGGSLMTPLTDMGISAGNIALDKAGLLNLKIKEDKTPLAVVHGGNNVPMHELLDTEAVPPGCIVIATTEIPMRKAIELRQFTGYPLLFVEDGKCIGILGDDEIYKGLLHQAVAV
jgi:glycine betaine/proline transport system ATP-binding protein